MGDAPWRPNVRKATSGGSKLRPQLRHEPKNSLTTWKEPFLEDLKSLSGSGRTGFSDRILEGGIEPDPRFTFANERTFLAWIRTSLALLAGGVAMEAFTADLFGPELRKMVAVLLLVLALLIGGGSFFRCLNIERAMRRKEPLPLPWIAPVLAIGGALVAAIMAVFVLVRPV